MLEIGTVADRLARNRYVLADASHIEVDHDAVKTAGVAGLLERICPAHVFSQAPDGSLVVQHAACLECGACLAVAPAGSLLWHYPPGGSGVVYREG